MKPKLQKKKVKKKTIFKRTSKIKKNGFFKFIKKKKIIKNINSLFRKKIFIAKWELNLLSLLIFVVGISSGLFFSLYNLGVILAAPVQDSVTITSDGEWNSGSLTDITVGSGSIEINGDGGSNWWSGSYSFRKQITVTNNVGSEMPSGYTVSLTLDHADLVTNSKSLSTGNDVRIVYWDGGSNIEIDRTLSDGESWNQSDTTIQYKTQAAIPASSVDTNYYIYYGNNSASNPPVDKTGVFALWDDFEDGNADGWTTASMGGNLGSASVVGGEYMVNVTNNNWVAFWNTTAGNLGDYEQIYKVTADTLNSSHKLISAGGRYQDANGSYLTGRWSNNQYLYRRVGGGWTRMTSVPSTSNSTGIQYYFKVQFIGYSIKLKVWQVGQAEPGSWQSSVTDTNSSWASGYPGFSHYAGIIRVDDFQVRRVMVTEPSTSLGSEVSSLQSPGTYTSHNLDVEKIYAWGDCTGGPCNDSSTAFTANVTIPANTTALFEMRSSANGSDGWSSWTTIHNQTSPLTGTITKTRSDIVTAVGDIFNRYVQVKITLTSSDGSSNPSIADYQLDYTTDVDNPTNPTDQNGYSDSGMGTAITTSNWYNYTDPHFTWSGATDDDAGMVGGYAGYWVCFGAVDCEPTDGTFVTTAAYTASSLTTNTTYYLRIKSRDAAGNIASSSYDAFEYRYDVTNPNNPAGITPNPAGFSSNTTFDFTWSIGSDTGGSGVSQYCYKTGDPSYAGDSGPGTDTCVSSAVTTATSIPKYKDGPNLFYVRTKDTAGNLPTFYTQTQYFYSGSAPTPPQGLTADPSTNTENSFTFNWFPPASYSPAIKGYYYSVNQLPSAETTTFTTQTSVGPGAFATQQGSNLFYVVAQDTADNIEWTSYAQVEFTANTVAPGIPTSITVTDSSIRAESKYLLTVTWNEPSEVGSGIDHYVIERSTEVDCATNPDPDSIFTELATTSAEGYLDSGLSNTTEYCYRIKAADNAGATSEASSIVSMIPEGKYTEPPTLIVGPEVQPLIQSATVTWETDREGSSFVEFGPTDALGRILGQDDFVTEHSVQLLDLDPDTTYHYRVKYTDQDGNIGYSSISTFDTADAPSAPVNLTVTPSVNTVNSFAFNWDPPTDEGVEIKGYYYSINATPLESNTSYTTLEQLSAGAFATQQGINVFYVVAMDSDNNVNFNNYASVEFQASTPAPAIPTGIIITDASNRETEDYSIALKWSKVTLTSGGTVTYHVYRSTNGEDFESIAQLQTTGYLDVDLDNTTEYFYYVKASDDAGSISAASTTVSEIPEGRYTTPPEITSGPLVAPDSFSCVVTWDTERETTSFVQYGLTEELGEEQGESDLITEHVNQILGLNPESTYYYRVKSVDVDGNIALSPIKSFATLEAPRVSDVLVSDVKLYDALVSWTTNKDTTSRIDYGATTSYGSVVYDTSNSLTKSHTLKLTGLVDGTTYHFRPTGEDANGNPPESGDYSFQTLTFPEVLEVSYENKSEGQTEIKWTTNVPTTSIVEYYNDQIAPKTQGNQAFTTEHSVLLFGLEDATIYQYRVKGTDQFGYNAQSEENEFITLEDTTPPEIFSTQSESNTIGSGETSTVQIVVSWKTDEPTTSQVEFGVGLAGADYTDQTEENAELVMDHLVVISNLAAAKTYHFRVISTDKAGNQTKSGSYTVLTTRKRESFLQLVISNLEETFSWIGSIGNLGN